MKEMMKKVKERREGFTMAELLIVVAIIAVLVAIAIPVFNGQLNKSKYATDEANARSLYSEISADYLANGGTPTATVTGSITKGTQGTITVSTPGGTTNTYKFNGMADITVTAGTADAAPSVTIGACDQNGNKAVTFPTASGSGN